VGAFVVPCCKAAALLEFREEIFNQGPGLIPFLIILAVVFPVFPGRYTRLNASVFPQGQPSCLRVIRLVSQQRLTACPPIGP
jgi:hypothetical protein